MNKQEELELKAKALEIIIGKFVNYEDEIMGNDTYEEYCAYMEKYAKDNGIVGDTFDNYWKKRYVLTEEEWELLVSDTIVLLRFYK